MKQYELTLIFDSQLTEKKADDIIEKLKVKELHRQVWGKRLLAYPIKKKKEGLYIFLVIALSPHKVADLEKKIRIEPKIIRYLLVRSEKEL